MHRVLHGAFGEGHLAPQDAVATAVQTKASWRSARTWLSEGRLGKFRGSCQDEECALMMAAKHKETCSRRGLQMCLQQCRSLNSWLSPQFWNSPTPTLNCQHGLASYRSLHLGAAICINSCHEAALLQMREQQIEDLQSQCEAQHDNMH